MSTLAIESLDGLAAQLDRACGSDVAQRVLPDGVVRWLDAAAAEDASRGEHIDADTLHELAQSLNSAAMPVPVDGGPGSTVHGNLHDAATPASGWAHRGVVARLPDGREHLFLLCELRADVAELVDAGSLAFGSVHMRFRGKSDAGAYRGAALLSHALTNRPAIKTLLPSTAVRSEQTTDNALRAEGIEMTIAKQIAKSEAPPAEAGADLAAEVAAIKESLAKLAADVAALTELMGADKKADEAAGEGAPAEVANSEGAKASAEVAALIAERDALRAELEGRAKEAAFSAAVEEIDAAVASGRVLKVTRDAWIEVAKSAGIERFRELTKSTQAVPTGERVALATQVKPKTARFAEAARSDVTSVDDMSEIMRRMGANENLIARVRAKAEG